MVWEAGRHQGSAQDNPRANLALQRVSLLCETAVSNRVLYLNIESSE